MACIPTYELRKYMLRTKSFRCSCACATPPCFSSSRLLSRSNHTLPTPDSPQTAPVLFRKQLKEQARALKASDQKPKKKRKVSNQTVHDWELTVGIEIHAQLNTAHKLFSPAAAPNITGQDLPNTHVALFDLAIPGSQPIFQPATLVPALRAALALECAVQPVSRFDRKHYFHWDQPAGYQLTQYYEPFARDGRVELRARDGIASEDGEGLVVGIKQVQMEQDTAKTIADPGGVHRLDFNRVGVPLIEIITHPVIHHPATAAAFVRKVQMLLNAVDACVSGMESGGIRADVNVSVRRIDDPSAPLGTQTEIKNLSSLKAVEDAIIAERDRQISVLKEGGIVAGETRGWSLGSTQTRRLRGKEGEVDYRYMPDPDLGPVVIGDDLVEQLRETMGILPDKEINELIALGLSSKDALTLMTLDNGGRLEFFYKVLERMRGCEASADAPASLIANWCLHEFGKLADYIKVTPEGNCSTVSPEVLADILSYLHKGRITAKVAKDLLWTAARGQITCSVTRTVQDGDLWFRGLSDKEYAAIADDIISGEAKTVSAFLKFKVGKLKVFPQGKLMFLIGKMMRAGPQGRMDPKAAERVLRVRLDEKYLPELEFE